MKHSKQSIVIKDLSDKAAMDSAYPLVAQMYPNMAFSDYSKYVDEMIEVNHFKMIAAFDGEKMVGVTGYWVLRMLYCGRYIQVSNLVVDKDARSKGVGKKILSEIEKIGIKLGCNKMVLDSYTENKRSHSLYFRENFYIRGFHFMKDL